MRNFVNFSMQKWFNSLSNPQSIAFTLIFFMIGVYIFRLRISHQIGFGYFISIGILIEAMILNYKKYLVGKNIKTNNEGE